MHAKQIVGTRNAPAAIGPYSQAVWAGDVLFCSGQMPLDPATGEVVGTNVSEQVHQALANVRALLEAAGLCLDNIVKVTAFLKDLDQFQAFNEAYADVFQAPFPARSAIEAARLPRDVLVEIEVIAAK